MYSFDPDPFAQRNALPDRPARKPELFNAAPEPDDAAAGGTRRTAGERRVRGVGGTAGPVHRAARWQVIRLHAAGGVCRRLFGSGGGDRRTAAYLRHARHDRGLRAAV